jgi:hypothetical protein
LEDVAVVLHLRPARDHVAGESKPAIEMGHFSRRISVGTQAAGEVELVET